MYDAEYEIYLEEEKLLEDLDIDSKVVRQVCKDKNIGGVNAIGGVFHFVKDAVEAQVRAHITSNSYHMPAKLNHLVYKPLPEVYYSFLGIDAANDCNNLKEGAAIEC